MPVTCGDIINNSVTVQEQNTAVTVNESSVQVITVAGGLRGPTGPQGPVGLSGAGEPFYALITGSLYATSASLSIFGYISSSILPYSSSGGGITSFSLGSVERPWHSLYVGTSSIHFVHNQEILASIGAIDDYVAIGDSRIGTASFGFTSTIITKRSSFADIDYTGSLTVHTDGTSDIIAASSQSTDYWKVNTRGIVVFGEFTYLPTPVPGGMIFSGSSFYIGE